MGNVKFDDSYPFLIEIGDSCRIASGVRILAHDATTFRELGVTRIAPVRILPGTFIGERAVILPGVTIGPHALIGAGSVVNRDVGEDRAVAGNPARPYGTYSDLLMKYRKIANSGLVFNRKSIEQGTVTTDDLARALEKDRIGFVRGVPQRDPFYIGVEFAEIRLNALRAYNRLRSSEKPLISATREKGSLL
jgi:carbonic anhydrase/acetyltransferase-like protein (isoleucine patch superfamily)